MSETIIVPNVRTAVAEVAMSRRELREKVRKSLRDAEFAVKTTTDHLATLDAEIADLEKFMRETA